MSKLNFRGRNKNQEYDEAKENAVKTVYKPKRNEGIGVPYQKYIDDKNIEVNEMNSIDPEIINQARQAEDLRRNPWRGENCPENAKNCIIGALTWAFPTKSNTIQYDSEKKITVARNPENPTIQRNIRNPRNLILLIKSPKGLDVSNIHPQITYSIKNM